jgi:RecA/RadA recombinase
MNNRVIVVAIALVIVFLAGFVPEYVKANRLENELRQSRQEGAGAVLRDLVGLAYVQANQKNFGLAAQTSSRFFSRAREMANQAQDATGRKALEDLLALRDKVTAELAKGDAAVMGDLQELFVKTRQATESSSKLERRGK